MPSLGIAPRPGGCIGRERNADAGRGAGFRRRSGGWIFASSGDWDSGSVAFTVSHESRDALLLTSGRSRRFPGMLLSLTTLSGRGQPSDSRTFLRVLPGCTGNTTERLAAQFRHITRIPRRAAPYAWTRPPVSWHAIFPFSPFGSWVSHQIQRPLLPSLPATRAIQRCASWRSYNEYRPHRALGQAAPLRPLHRRTPTAVDNVRRRDRLGGLLHEYQQVA